MRCIFRSQRYIQSGGHSGVMVVFTRVKVRVTLWGLYLNVYIYVYRRGLGPSLEHFPAPSYGAMVPGSVRRGLGRSPCSHHQHWPTFWRCPPPVHRSHVAKDNHKNVQTCRGKYLAFLQKFYNRPSLTFPQSGSVVWILDPLWIGKHLHMQTPCRRFEWKQCRSVWT